MINTHLNIKISDYLKNKNASFLEHKDNGGNGFDPNQPRDEKGRWTSTGAISSKTVADIATKSREAVNTVDTTIKSTSEIKGKPKYKKYDNLSNKEMDDRIQRLNKEHQLSDLQGETQYVKSGKDKIREALQTVGAALAAVATVFTIRHLILQDKKTNSAKHSSIEEYDENYLEHFGIPGMRWGHRKDVYNINTSSSIGRKLSGVKTLTPTNGGPYLPATRPYEPNWTKGKDIVEGVIKEKPDVGSSKKMLPAVISNGTNKSAATTNAVNKVRKKRCDAGVKRGSSKANSNRNIAIALGLIGAATIIGGAYYLHKRNKKKEEMKAKFNSSYHSAIDKVEGTYLMHYGKKGQKWGIRNYQNPDGSLTPKGEREYKKNAKISGQSKGQIMGSLIGGGLVATTLALKRVKSKSVKNPNVFSGGLKIVSGVLAGAMIGSIIGKKIGKSEGKGDMAEYKNAYITSDVGRRKKRR